MTRHSPADPTLHPAARAAAFLDWKQARGQAVNLARLFPPAASVTPLRPRPPRVDINDTKARRDAVARLEQSFAAARNGGAA